MSPNGFAVSHRLATASLRCACQAARRRGVSMNASPRRKLRRAFLGAASTGFGATSGSCHTPIPTAIIGWRVKPCFRMSPFPKPISMQCRPRACRRRKSATAYEGTLKRFYDADALAADRPLFDVTLLGIGDDGHTASLFPGQPALQETRRWAVAVVGAKAEARITLTYPALDSSREVAFLVTGEAKRGVVARAQAGDHALPAAMICPVGGLHWFTDRAAAPAGVN